MDERLVRSLTGRSFPRTPAVLHDFERTQRPGDYAFIRPRPGGRVDGVLLSKIDELSLVRFDEYEEEGRLYRRIEVSVVCAGAIHPCFTYCALAPAPDPA